MSFPNRIAILDEGDFLGSVLEAHRIQIALVGNCQGALAWISAAVPQQKCLELLTGLEARASGYALSEMSFSSGPMRYRNRHSRPPVGVTNRKSPRSSNSLYARSRGLAERILASVSCVTSHPRYPSEIPQVQPGLRKDTVGQPWTK